jgi:hypothetical protein
MKDIAILLIHLLTTVAKLLGAGWREGHHCRKPSPQAATAGCHTFPPTGAESFNG